jgi:ATP-dependent helicase/nuclease subunit B
MRAAVGALGTLAPLGGAVTRAAFLEALDRECSRRELRTETRRGVAVLDAMAARGLSFRHVFVLGLNARTFPRFIVEEPFISDAVRREVFRSLGHHVAVRMDGYDEERLLFHLVRSAATERCVCLYQRADAKGRLRDPSPFLRPFLSADRGQVPRVPRSPAAKRDAPVVHTPRELILLAPDMERALAVFGYDAAGYARGRAVLRALSDPERVSAFEGRTGPLPGISDRWTRGGITPTHLETYGVCPFRFFAQHVLELSIEDGADGDLAPREIGRLLHAILEAFHRERCECPEPDTVAVRAVAAGVFARFEAEANVRLDGLRAVQCERLVRAAEAFCAWDLAHAGPWRPTWFEAPVEGDFAGVRIRGRLDRIDCHRETGALRVVEYKRRHSSGWETGLVRQAQRGRRLAPHLYLATAPEVARRAGVSAAMATGVAVHFVESYLAEVETAEAGVDRHLRQELSAGEAERVRGDVERAVITFAAMMRDGWFFVRPDERQAGACSHCQLGAVCRKGHPGLRDKVHGGAIPELGPYWDVVRPRRARS